MSERCRYCFAPIEPEWVKVEVERTRAEILTSTDLWAPDETLPLIRREMDCDLVGTGKRLVRVRVNKAEYCPETHRLAMKGNRSPVAESLGEFRDEGETPETVAVHPGQGTLI